MYTLSIFLVMLFYLYYTNTVLILYYTMIIVYDFANITIEYTSQYGRFNDW